MIDQTGISATAYFRIGDIWSHHILREDSILSLPEIGLELPLVELYEGVDFNAEEPHSPE